MSEVNNVVKQIQNSRLISKSCNLPVPKQWKIWHSNAGTPGSKALMVASSEGREKNYVFC